MSHTPEPIFKTIFGADWAKMPRVFHRHYACRAGTDDTAACDGVMDIEASFIGRLLAPLFYLSGTLVPYRGRGIRAQVGFAALQDTDQKGLVRNGFLFDRVFYFPDKKPYRFTSRLVHIGGNEVVEQTRMGFGWRAAFVWTGDKIDMQHRGYTLRIFGRDMPFPGEWFLGRASASETALDDDRFAMTMEIRHPLWGRVFAYSGIFTMTKDSPA